MVVVPQLESIQWPPRFAEYPRYAPAVCRHHHYQIVCWEVFVSMAASCIQFVPPSKDRMFARAQACHGRLLESSDHHLKVA